MNWYKKAKFDKRASVSFWPAGSDKISQPMTVSDICNEMIRYGWYVGKIFREGQGMYHDTISPDGDDYFEHLGIINIYVPESFSARTDEGEFYRENIPVQQRLNEKQVQTLVKEFNDHMAGLVVLGDPKEDMSSGGRVVYRVQVLENSTKDLEQVPEMNMANSNAKAILEILAQHGLNVTPSEYAGAFSVDEYLGARQLMIDETLEQHERPETEESNMFGFGLSLDKINAYLDGLDQLAAWIRQNNLPDQKIVFG